MVSKISFISLLLLTFFLFSSARADVFVVDRSDDVAGANACTAAVNDCTLRGAIQGANDNGPGLDTINFNIPGSGVHKITLVFELPEINSTLTINGASQSGYFGKPMIEIDGGNAVNGYGFSIDTPTPYADIAVTIIGLSIYSQNHGVYSRSCYFRCDVTLLGNFIGTDASGTIAKPNWGSGVDIAPRGDITIGGEGLFEGNLISGNGDFDSSNPDAGINIEPVPSDTPHGPYNVKILGNKIGTDFSGTDPLANGDDGITVTEFDYLGGHNTTLNVTIGGTTALARNIISGNNEDGIDLRVSLATVIGNYIGTNVAGTGAVGNGNPALFLSSDGISITAQDGGNYYIGGDSPGKGNVISGCKNGSGIGISNGAGGSGTAQLTVQGNYIGTNYDGSAALGNSSDGMIFIGSNNYIVNAVIGGVTADARNIISGNQGGGILADGGNINIYGNYIGTDKTGSSDLGNGSNGVTVTYKANVKIGGTLIFNGTQYDAGNVISGNQGEGISAPSFSDIPVLIRRNRIGTNAGGTSAIPNSKNGINIGTGGAIIGSDANANDGNVISGNTLNGILLDGDAHSVSIFANKIGTNSVGGSPLPNGQNGIKIDNSQNNQIGVAGNGVSTNIISSNTGDGILFTGAGTTGNRVENNIIGTGIAFNDLGNNGSGVRFTSGANGNFVGNSNGGGNTILNNATGVWVQNGTNNEIRRNAIFSNDGLGIDLDAAGVTPNDAGDADTGANHKQNFPVLGRSTPSAISGTLNSTTNGNFTIDFYRVDSCDANGYGEGRYYLGTTLVATDGSGNGPFNFPAGVAIGQIVTATATVTDIVGADDTSEFSQCKVVTAAPTFAFSTASYTVSEGATSRTIIVNRGGATDGIATVNYATNNGTATAGQDYTATSGTLTFGDGETIKTFDVLVLPDTIDEADETVNLTLSNPTGGAGLGTPSTAVLTIVDNDNPPTISITDVTANEGNSGTTAFTFHVQLSAPSGLLVMVNYATANGTAAAPSDYGSANGSLNFIPGDTDKMLTVPVVGDTTNEPDENFFINLSGPINATIADNQGVGTIINDDAPATTWSIRGAVTKQGGTPMSGVTVTLQGSSETQTTSDANGRYVFSNLAANGSYTVSASAAGYAFAPPSRSYPSLSNDVSAADFVGTSRNAGFDFDGDGKTDLSVFRPSDGNWYLFRSTAGVAVTNWGVSSDVMTPADFDGDGKTDVSVFRPGTGQWFILRSSDSAVSIIAFGVNGDKPVAGDYDGDGKADVAQYRPSDGNWYVYRSSDGAVGITNWGNSSDKVVAGDYDGDGKYDQAVYRPSTGQWFVFRSTAGPLVAGWGTTGDKPVVGDYDGDGKCDLAVYRPGDGNWYVYRSSDSGVSIVNWGSSTDFPVPGDYDGDGKADQSVYRNGTWFVNKSTGGYFQADWGVNTDKPIPAANVP